MLDSALTAWLRSVTPMVTAGALVLAASLSGCAPPADIVPPTRAPDPVPDDEQSPAGNGPEVPNLLRPMDGRAGNRGGPAADGRAGGGNTHGSPAAEAAYPGRSADPNRMSANRPTVVARGATPMRPESPGPQTAGTGSRPTSEPGQPARSGSATSTPTDPRPKTPSPLPDGRESAAGLPAPYFSFERPFASEHTQGASRFYPYGTTADGAYLLHHGIDISNPEGTPVLAVADGVVFFAGDDLEGGWGPMPDFYGRLVVIEHRVGDGYLFSLYGHVSQVLVAEGDVVAAGDPVALVGGLGVALGPHLHLEIRSDARDYGATLNPELFLKPLPGTGVLVGRAVDRRGDVIVDAGVSLYRVDEAGTPRWIATTTTYPAEHVNPEPTFRENFAFGDLEPGRYALGMEGRAPRIEEAVEVRAGAVKRITLIR